MNGYKRVALVGFNSAVGSFALGLRRAGFRGTLVGVADAATVEQCWKLGIITDGSDDLGAALAGSDLVMLSQESGHSTGQLAKVLLLADDGATISEMTRVKGDVNRIFESSGRADVHYVGFRLLGDARVDADVAQSSKFFFENKTVILTPRGKEDLDAFSQLQDAMRRMGAAVVAMSPQSHDKLLAQLTQVPKAAVVAILQGIFEDTETIQMTPEMLSGWLVSEAQDLAVMKQSGWTADIEANRELVLQGMDRLIERLRAMRGEIAAGRLAAQLNTLVDRAGVKLNLDQKKDRTDLILSAGADSKVLERVSEILAKARIPIGKLERMEFAEAGTYRLSLNSVAERDRAVSLLRNASIEVSDLS
jgi:prephenate dehydrogenase